MKINYVNIIFIVIIITFAGVYFDSKFDVCFCEKCHEGRGDNLYYTRGQPPKDYGLPIGWCKFALKYD